MIDINEPVKRGADVVLNFDGEEARLGTTKDFEKAEKAGKLISLPPNDNPNGDVNPPDSYENT